jgi:uncharacterized membrane protein
VIEIRKMLLIIYSVRYNFTHSFSSSIFSFFIAIDLEVEEDATFEDSGVEQYLLHVVGHAPVAAYSFISRGRGGRRGGGRGGGRGGEGGGRGGGEVGRVVVLHYLIPHSSAAELTGVRTPVSFNRS